MGDKAYITSQIDEESELYQRFEDYVEAKGHDNKSAAVRELVHSALLEKEAAASRPGGYSALERALLTVSGGLAAIVLLLPLLYFAGIFPWEVTFAAGAVYLFISASLALGVSFGVFRWSRADPKRDSDQEVSS
jgi:hypothetical protein